MKEMLFITVAILIPPSLTYMGFVGGDSVPADHSWQAVELAQAATPSRHNQAQGDELANFRWLESSL